MGFVPALYKRYGMWKVGVSTVALIIVGITFLVLILRGGTEVVETGDEPLSVTTAPIATLSGDDSRTFVGTVVAVSQAKLQTETSGRVTALPVTIGQRVAAGSIIAQLENTSERAALTQAEGAYEAARASAIQSDSGTRDAQTALTSAQNSALTTMRNAYTSANSVLVTDIDPFFSSPQSAIPGLRVTGPTSYLNTERVAFQTLLPLWQQAISSATTESDLTTLLVKSEGDTERLIAVLDALIDVTTSRSDDTLNGQRLGDLTARLLAARATLDGTVSALQSAASSIAAARESLARAEVSGTNANVSLANAQVKQALGALQAAQAAYAKTIVRSPIAGTVNALQVKIGDTVGQGTAVAEVVNDSAYELSFFVTESERAAMNIGDVVQVDGTATGTITSIAPAFDPRTQKIEVKVALEATNRLSGSTAVVSLTSTATTWSSSLFVPLTAIAFSVDGGALLTVTDGKVAALPVTLGEIRGSRVAISGEVTPETVIIVDARGLIVGQQVSVTQ